MMSSKDGRRRDVEDAFGIGLSFLPFELRRLIVQKQLEDAGASGEVRETIFSLVSKDMKSVVDDFLKMKKGDVIRGELLNTEARYMLYASPRWKLITSLSWEITAQIVNAVNMPRLGIRDSSGILFIGKDQGSWTDVLASFSKATHGSLMFEVRSTLITDVTKLKILKDKDGETSTSIIDNSSVGRDFGPTIIYSLVNNPQIFSAYSLDSEAFPGFIRTFLNLYPEDRNGPRAHELNDNTKNVVIVRFESIKGGTDIPAELLRIEKEDPNDMDEFLHWDNLRSSPWNYSFSTYIPPIFDTSRERTGLLIIPDSIFYTFLQLEVGRFTQDKLFLHFGDIIVRISSEYTSYEIGSNSIISHQPFDIIFLTDDMPISELEMLGIVQTGRTEQARAMIDLPTW